MVTKNKKLGRWVDEMTTLCQPDNVVWCDGSKNEWSSMWDILIKSGTAKKLDEKKAKRDAKEGKKKKKKLISLTFKNPLP